MFEKPPAVAQVIFPEYMSKKDRELAIKSGQEKIYDFIMKQPPYLTQNWLQITGSAEKEYVKCIRVGYDSVLTVTNERLVIRHLISGGVPGFYYIRDEEDLKHRGPDGVVYLSEISRFSGFKDVQPLAPDFEELATFEPAIMDGSLAQQFCQWAQAVKSVDGDIVLDADRAFIRQDPNNLERSFNFRFNLKKKAILVPDDIIHAFKECMRYDYFYITRKPDEKRSMPLVLGRNWAHCILVVTKDFTHY